MRRIAILLTGVLFASNAQAALRVFSCEPEWAALVETLGAGRVEAFSATTASQDVHFIQARPSLIAHLRRADLLVCTGAGLEAGWLPVLLRRANNPRVLPGQRGHLELSRHVELIDQPARIDRAEGDVHPEGNPHFHLDARNLLPAADALTERLIALDPSHAANYRAAAAAFRERWTAALNRWQEQATPLQGRRVVVHHLDWNYLVPWFGLELAGTLEPKPGVPPSSGHLSELQRSLEAAPAACILRTTYQSARASEWLAGRVRITPVVLPHTVAGDEKLDTLFDDILEQLLEHCQ